jgi:hypothetical protein
MDAGMCERLDGAEMSHDMLVTLGGVTFVILGISLILTQLRLDLVERRVARLESVTASSDKPDREANPSLAVLAELGRVGGCGHYRSRLVARQVQRERNRVLTTGELQMCDSSALHFTQIAIVCLSVSMVMSSYICSKRIFELQKTVAELNKTALQ